MRLVHDRGEHRTRGARARSADHGDHRQPAVQRGQLNENDNNKNRKYDGDRPADSTRPMPRTRTATQQECAFRPVREVLPLGDGPAGGRDGIVCFVSNNGFVDQIAFDGMRKHLLQDFTHIYHFDLHGNVRKNPKLSGTTYNVFGIQVGVGITVAVGASRDAAAACFSTAYRSCGRRKLAWLASDRSVTRREVAAARAGSVATLGSCPSTAANLREFIPLGLEGAFLATAVAESSLSLYSLGVKTNRDVTGVRVRAKWWKRVSGSLTPYNGEVDR